MSKEGSKVHRRLLGTIYGHCMGDAIGLLSEFMVEDEAKKYYGKKRGKLVYGDKVPDMHRSRWEAGDWTDDSDQMILIMQSLIENNGKVDPVDYGARLVKWKTSGFEELGDKGGMGIGATTVKVLTHHRFQTDPQFAARDVWEKNGRTIAPNGGVMRTSVLGLYMYHDMDAVVRNSRSFCTVTHADPRCEASCVAVAVAIALMMQAAQKGDKVNLKSVMEQSYEHAAACIVDDTDDVKAQKLEELREHMFAGSLAKLNLAEHKRIGYTYKCMGAGFWALRQAKRLTVKKKFRAAMEEVVFAAGDADTNGAVAGAMLGCKVGVHKLPAEWMAFKHKAWLDAIIDKFVQLIEHTSPSHPKIIKEPSQADGKPDKKHAEQGKTGPE